MVHNKKMKDNSFNIKKMSESVAEYVFANAITLENAKKVRNDRYKMYLEKQKQKNIETLENIPKLINEHRIKNPNDCWIKIGLFNEELANSLKERGFIIDVPGLLQGPGCACSR